MAVTTTDSQDNTGNDAIFNLWRLIGQGSWLAGQQYPVTNDRVIIGRSKECDITIPGTHLSRQHAELSLRAGKLFVKDLGSANGTFVNGERVEAETTVMPGDTVRFDVYSFTVEGPKGVDASGQRAALTKKINPHESLENIKALKDQGYQEKKWKTKPTSHGNRQHEVPGSNSNLGFNIMIAAFGFALVVVAALYLFL